MCLKPIKRMSWFTHFGNILHEGVVRLHEFRICKGKKSVTVMTHLYDKYIDCTAFVTALPKHSITWAQISA